jgi:hypothetical protein
VNRERALIKIIALVIVIAMATPVLLASGDVEAKRVAPIKIRLGVAEQSLPASMSYYVTGGSVWADWSKQSAHDKKMFLSDQVTYFELYIDGISVGLTKTIERDKVWESPQWGTLYDCILKLWNVTFPANYFQAGQTYEFHAIWHEWGYSDVEKTTLVTFY